MYREVDYTATNEADGPQDNMGYIGLAHWYRDKKQLIPCTEKEFLREIYHNNKLKEIMLTIREIDKDHNGYVTRTELDDILKLYYK